MNATHAYIGRCPTCNAVPFVTVDDPTHAKYTAREVAKEMRLGSIIDRVPIEHIHNGTVQFGRCTCTKKKATS